MAQYQMTVNLRIFSPAFLRNNKDCGVAVLFGSVLTQAQVTKQSLKMNHINVPMIERDTATVAVRIN